MSDPRHPFESDYGGEPQVTGPAGAASEMTAPEGVAPASQTVSAGATLVQSVDELIESSRYGMRKPHRVVIRGKISRE